MELIKAGRNGNIGNKYLFECETCGSMFKASEEECARAYEYVNEESYRTVLTVKCPCCGDSVGFKYVDKFKNCNICGETLSYVDVVSGISLEKIISYGSIHDGGKLDIHICCNCMDDLIDRCTIYPVSGEEFEF